MKKNILILAILILPTIVPLFRPGYFPIHDDLQVVRQMMMENCIKDVQIPCRWVKDLGFGYGYPLFVYYPPLPYIVGEAFRLIGFSFLGTIKLVGILGFVGAALAMYWLGRQLWGEKGAILAALLYTYAPYRAVNFYVRAAVNEFWAGMFFPIILLAIYKIIHKGGKGWVLGLALGFAGLMTTHNQMLMIFTPVIILWTIYWWVKVKSIQTATHLGLGSMWGFALAAFYFLPILIEQKYAHLQTLVIGYFNYLAHFLDLNQIFLRINWGYGSSIYGSEDTMSFALGYAQWIVPAIVILSIIISKKLRKHWLLLLLLLSLGLWSLFMAHSKSTFIWKIVTPLEFLQFPWRFLSVAIFVFSFLGGSLALVLSRKTAALVLVVVVFLTANYFQPREWYPNMTDADKFTGKTWVLMTTNAIFDYLPIDAPQPPADPPKADVVFVSGAGKIIRLEKNSHFQRYRIDVEKSGIVEVQTYYFPGWHVYLDGIDQLIDPKRDPVLGRMQVDINTGTHQLVAKFERTWDRKLADTISLVTWVITIGIMGVWWKIRQK